MTKLSLIDSIQILWNVMTKSNNAFLILLVLVVIGIGSIFINNKNKKIYKVIYSLIMLSVIGYVVISYNTYLGRLVQYMMDNFFIAFYFPNTAIYLFAIITMNIVVWVTVLNNKSSKQIKTMNSIVYVIMTYLFILLIGIIKKEKLDIFTQTSIYENTNARALIQLSSTIFMLWIILLILYKIILIYLQNSEPKELNNNYNVIEAPSKVYSSATNTVTYPEYKIVSLDSKEKEYNFIEGPEKVHQDRKTAPVNEKDYEIMQTPEKVYQERKGPHIISFEPVDEKDYEMIKTPERVYQDKKPTKEKDYQFTTTPKLIRAQAKQKKVTPVVEQKQYQPTIIPDSIFRKVMKKVKPEKEVSIKQEEQSFTKEDYQLFSTILKNEQRKMQERKNKNLQNSYRAMNNSKTAELFGTIKDIELDNTISDTLENTKEEIRNTIISIEENKQNEEQRLIEKAKEDAKMTELERLYQSINI